MAPVDITLPYGMLPKDHMNLETIFGPFFLAQCFNWCLYGILCLQVYIYTIRFRKDLAYIKWLVAIVFILDSFSIALVTHAAWRVLVSHWGDVNIVNHLDWTWATVPIATGVVSSIVQMFFVWRIWQLSRSFVMPIIITLVILTYTALAIRTGFVTIEFKNFRVIRTLVPGLWVGGSMLADILISITLGRILWAGRTGFKDTDSAIIRLIRLTIQAAAVPAIAHISELILIYTANHNEHLLICVALARLYSNTLLAMLNSRDELFGGGRPNPTCGAARLSEDTSNKTFLRHLIEKFSIRSNGSVDSQSSTAVADSRNSRGRSLDDSVLKDKILVRQHTISDGVNSMDVDLERAVELPYRPSIVTFDDISPTDSTKTAIDEFPPMTPAETARSDARVWGRRLSRTPAVKDETKVGVYDTYSQFPPPFHADGSPMSPPSTHPTFTSPNHPYSGPH